MKTHWGVNWKNGMKISSEHFLKERLHHNFMTSLVQNAMTTDYKYGLIEHPVYENLKYSLYNNRFTIESCYGISRGGVLLFVNEQNNKKINSLQLQSIRSEYKSGDVIQIYIRLLTDTIQEFGIIDGEAFPANYPDASYNYQLEYYGADTALDNDNLSFVLPIAQLIVKQDGIDITQDYIPPVYHTRASDKLMEYHRKFNEFNFELARLNSTIAQNIGGDAHGNFRKANILVLTNTLGVFIADQLDQFTYKYQNESPLEMFLFFRKISRLINASLINMQNRSEMVKLMGEWSGISEADFLSKLNEINSIEYTHNDVKRSMDVINRFVVMMNKLFLKIGESNF